MSPVQGIRTPRGVLYRIGRLPDPSAFPPWHVQGHGRFDDPQRHAVVRLRVMPRQRWLDLRAPATREVLRTELAATLLTLGFSDLDLGHVLGSAQALTQAISRWAHEQGYAGLAYPSRLDAKVTLWALFEGAAFASIGEPEPITPDDPDLAATARLYGLLV